MTAPLLLLCLLPAAAVAAMVGGRVNITVERTYEPVVYAVKEINNKFRANGDTTVRHLEEIINSQSQVVAGQKLYLTLRLTGDSKGDDYCKVNVWYRPWLKDATRLNISGKITCSKRPEPVIGLSSPSHG